MSIWLHLLLPCDYITPWQNKLDLNKHRISQSMRHIFPDPRWPTKWCQGLKYITPSLSCTYSAKSAIVSSSAHSTLRTWNSIVIDWLSWRFSFSLVCVVCMWSILWSFKEVKTIIPFTRFAKYRDRYLRSLFLISRLTTFRGFFTFQFKVFSVIRISHSKQKCKCSILLCIGIGMSDFAIVIRE